MLFNAVSERKGEHANSEQKDPSASGCATMQLSFNIWLLNTMVKYSAGVSLNH